ncbi:MAG: FAD-dependent oxidoreductase, partial [Intestinibacter sp.]|uniref:FAD-dependent oxidoreductase n=1 Tax=Intestinibacter sp. TaxID=1965304 RepID=UPI003F138237
MIDKLKNILGIGKKDDTNEIEVPASKIGPKTYVIIGASAAGVDAVKTLRKLDKSVKIIVISKDENIYSRCMLHHVISEHRTVEGINFVDADFMEKNN